MKRLFVLVGIPKDRTTSISGEILIDKVVDDSNVKGIFTDMLLEAGRHMNEFDGIVVHEISRDWAEKLLSSD